MLISLDKKYKELFNQVPLLVRSPGRINIIGEHTDYNEGFVLPAAIDKAIYVAVGESTENEIHLYSVDFKETHTASLNNLQPTKTWATYILGVADQLVKRGYKIGGFNLVIDGDVPLGAGLSSSAAVECATVFALNELFALGISKMEMVKIAQQAEHDFAGVMCGIMDQFASMFGKKDQVIKLDCRSLEFEYIPLAMQGYKLVLFNSNVKHSLASSEYNTRRQQCEQGVSWVKAHHPEVHSLRDVNMQMLQAYVLPKDELVYRRCKFVIDEIQRLLTGCEDLQKGDIVCLGKKMFALHEGLSKEYEVSCKELDYLVNAVRNNPAVLGARVMGGGFGGCTINIIREDVVDEIARNLAVSYKEAMGMELGIYTVQTEDGTSIVHV